eukprot:c20920_g1_i5.p1 GENE.c20920_g1_i5~~c20920_g1_i5.p1  ORF type:complete len:121 (-),score=43.34 c20920_g1_i5:285-647(-)
MISHVFKLIEKANENIEFTVKVSMVEIYIDSSKTNLSVHEDSSKGVYIDDATEEYVSSPEDVHELMRLGASLRAKASTDMNSESSRSHSIILEIKQRDVKTESVKKGKMYLVDLMLLEKD